MSTLCMCKCVGVWVGGCALEFACKWACYLSLAMFMPDHTYTTHTHTHTHTHTRARDELSGRRRARIESKCMSKHTYESSSMPTAISRQTNAHAFLQHMHTYSTCVFTAPARAVYAYLRHMHTYKHVLFMHTYSMCTRIAPACAIHEYLHTYRTYILQHMHTHGTCRCYVCVFIHGYL